MLKKPPLFTLELVYTDKGTVECNMPIQAFEEVISKALDNAIMSLQFVPQLEPAIMENLFWRGNPLIDAVQLLEPAVTKLRAQMLVSLNFCNVLAFL